MAYELSDWFFVEISGGLPAECSGKKLPNHGLSALSIGEEAAVCDDVNPLLNVWYKADCVYKLAVKFGGKSIIFGRFYGGKFKL